MEFQLCLPATHPCLIQVMEVTVTLARSPQALATPRVRVSVILTRTPLARAVRSMTLVPVTLSRPLTLQAQAAARHSNKDSVDNIQTNKDSVDNSQTDKQTTGVTDGEQARNTTGEQLTCNFKLEKPKLPKFTGDVREYAILRSDWKHIVDTRYAKRDAITLLRTNLSNKPLEFIKGIGTDYDAAWEYLDAIYGDPRFVLDSVTQDISKFKPLQDGEDSRFCDLVHLVRRSYNTLKEVGVPGDMDNSHMLSIIERKMGPDDRKVWSRDLEREGKPATLQGLLSWMTSEMKSRMRAIVPVMK